MDNKKKILLMTAGYLAPGHITPILEQVLQMEIGYLGYTEAADGWTMFGQWYADNIAHVPSFARDDWCAMFQTYCMYHCNVPGTVWPYISPQGSAVNYLAPWLASNGATEIPRTQMPRKCDIVLYSWTSDPNNLDHVGMIAEVTGLLPLTAQIKVIEGNKGGQVGYRNIAWTDSTVARVFRLHP